MSDKTRSEENGGKSENNSANQIGNNTIAQPALGAITAPHLSSGANPLHETQAPISQGNSRSMIGFSPPIKEGEVGVLGPFRIVKELGRGGMGAVYAAIDTRLERKLALKVILPEFWENENARERFLREARAAAKVIHDHVVTVYEADEKDGVPYIAMQYLHGYSLDEYLKKKGRLGISQVIKIIREASSGLAAAHRIGLVHRDIKPSNLWLEAPHGRVKILDFGLAKPMDSATEITRSGAIIGTPAYMSPEQARGEKVDHRTDIFSLGAVFYQLCTGILPFDGPTTMAVLMALGSEEPKSIRIHNPEVSDSIDRLVQKMLAKKAQERPQSALEIIKQLRSITHESEPTQIALQKSNPDQNHSLSNHITPKHLASDLLTSDLNTTDVNQAKIVSSPSDISPKGEPLARNSETNPFAEAILGTTEVDHPKILEPKRPSKNLSSSKIGDHQPTDRNQSTMQNLEDKKSLRWLWPLAAGLFILLVGFGILIFSKSPTNSNPQSRSEEHLREDPTEGPTEKITTTRKVDTSLPSIQKNKDASSFSTDRQAAEYVLSVGGSIRILGKNSNNEISNARDLPKDDFSISSIDFHENKNLSTKNFEVFQGCKEIRNLLLSNTNISDQSLINFKHCQNLEVLQIENTDISDNGIIHFATCSNLNQLFAANTKISDNGLSIFKECKKIESLQLGNTHLSDKGLANFQGCVDLRSLYLLSGNITDEGMANFKDSKMLTTLYIYNAKLTDIGLAYFKGCNQLNQLWLPHSKITDQGLKIFKNCRQLETINLESTLITDEGLAFFKDFTHINVFYLGSTKISDKGLLNLEKCKDLILLYLSDTQISDKGLEFLQTFTKLTYLDLDNVNISTKALEKFRNQLPQCKIKFDGHVIEGKR